MQDLDLTNLELQIETLLQDRRTLKDENVALRQKLFKITHERALLQVKNQSAASRIKRVISQLRSDLE